MKKILLILLFVSICSVANAERFFQTTSTWYQKIPESPTLHSGSASYVARLAALGGNIGLSYGEWSVPIYRATGAETPVTINISDLNDSTCGASRQITIDTHDNFSWNDSVPLDLTWKASSWGTSGYRDRHMVIVSSDGNTAWDMFQAYMASDPVIPGCVTTSYAARICKKWDLTGDGIPQPWPGASSSNEEWIACRVGISPLLHGLVTYDEVEAGVIDHALAMSYGGDDYTACTVSGVSGTFQVGETINFSPSNASATYRRTDGSWAYYNGTSGTPTTADSITGATSGATANIDSIKTNTDTMYPCDQDWYRSGKYDHQYVPLLGMRFYLDPTLDINDPADWGGNALSTGQKVVATALQEYGMIYVESAGPGPSSVYLENLTYDSRSWEDAAVDMTGAGGQIKPSNLFLLAEPIYPPVGGDAPVIGEGAGPSSPGVINGAFR